MKRIAVVEDDVLMHQVFLEIFVESGCVLEFWARGEAALAALAGSPPDLVLLDVNLPDMTGHEVLRRLKADARTARVPIVMLTGEARDIGSRVSGLDLGAEDYLFKPVSPKVLLARVGASLAASGERAR